VQILKKTSKQKIKRPTRDELELEELGERLVEAMNEAAIVQLEVWQREEIVVGRIVKLDSRTRLVHMSYRDELTKIAFMDIMKISHADYEEEVIEEHEQQD